MKRVGILYHPKLEKARDLVNELEELLSAHGVSSWQCSAWEESQASPQVSDSDLLLCIGGDGTVLRAVRISIPSMIPVLGINLGILGFTTELNADEAPSILANILEGSGWIDERTMLEVQLEQGSFHALNDVVMRSTTARLIHIQVEIDNDVLPACRADGIIVATATGSTAYSLAAGGPILHPQSKEMILQPISCHLGPNQALVLSPQSIIGLKVINNNSTEAILSLDGQVDLPLSNNQSITVKLSPYVARFLRIYKPTYSSLWEKLRGRK